MHTVGKEIKHYKISSLGEYIMDDGQITQDDAITKPVVDPAASDVEPDGEAETPAEETPADEEVA